MNEHIALRFDWEDVSHCQVTEFLGKNAKTMNDQSESWEEVAICLDGKSILLSVEPDTDQVEITLCESLCGDQWQPIPSFSFAIGKPLGWCWVGQNYLGYFDSFTLAFGDIVPDALEPRCTFLAEASTLICFDLAVRKA